MSWDVILLPRAHEDYKLIMRYLGRFYPSTPLRFDNEYLRTKSKLAYNPRCCSPYPDKPEYRRAIIGKYTMFYKIDEARREVHIHRILRSSGNIPQALQ